MAENGCSSPARIPEDKLWADALKRAAPRFGAKIVDEKVFEDRGGARQTDSGIAEIQAQIPLFTQGLPDHDVLLAADESAVFAAYLPYRTKVARPVAGLGGPCANELGPVDGAMGRDATAKPLHEAVFAADAGAGHAGVDGGAHDRRGCHPDEIGGARSRCAIIILSPAFELAAFKGQALDRPPLEPAASPAGSPERREKRRLGLAPAGLSAPRIGTRYAWLRQTGNKMRTEMMQEKSEAEACAGWEWMAYHTEGIPLTVFPWEAGTHEYHGCTGRLSHGERGRVRRESPVWALPLFSPRR